MVIEIRRVARSDRNAAKFYGYPYFTFYLEEIFLCSNSIHHVTYLYWSCDEVYTTGQIIKCSTGANAAHLQRKNLLIRNFCDMFNQPITVRTSCY